MDYSEEDMLRAVLAHPEDDAPRLIMADWYSDNGQEERGEFIRIQCELATRKYIPAHDHRNRPCKACQFLSRRSKLLKREEELRERWARHWVLPLAKVFYPDTKLIEDGNYSQHGNRAAGAGVKNILDSPQVTWEFKRGYVDSIRLDANTFLEKAGNVYPDLVPGTIFSVAPIRKVELTTRVGYSIVAGICTIAGRKKKHDGSKRPLGADWDQWLLEQEFPGVEFQLPRVERIPPIDRRFVLW